MSLRDRNMGVEGISLVTFIEKWRMKRNTLSTTMSLNYLRTGRSVIAPVLLQRRKTSTEAMGSAIAPFDPIVVNLHVSEDASQLRHEYDCNVVKLYCSMTPHECVTETIVIS